MRIKLTPLNIATAFLVVLAFISWQFHAVMVTGRNLVRWGGTVALIYMVLALMVFFLDMTFRYFFTKVKTLWVIELSFIALTAVLYLLAINK